MVVLATIFWLSWFCILYTYVLFPILLAFCTRLFAQQATEAAPESTSALPTVSMVVAAYNEAGVLNAKLRNTWQIDYPADRFEILIGSDGSEDGTAEILAGSADPRLRAFPFAERRGKISVLNELMGHVRSDIVVMSDANTMFAPDAVKKLVAHFQDPTVGCVSGELSLEQEGGVSGEGIYWKYEGWIKRNEGKLGFLIGCNGGIFAIRSRLFEKLPASTIVEDFVLSMRILERGHRVRFEPMARATEPACKSARAEMIRKIRIGAGGWQALRLTGAVLHPRFGLRAFAFWGHKVLRWLVPVFFLLALAANVGLAVKSVPLLVFLGLQVAGAAIALLAHKAGPEKSLPKWTRPISYFYLMNYALFRGLLRYLSGTQKVTWERDASVESAPSLSTLRTAETPANGRTGANETIAP